MEKTPSQRAIWLAVDQVLLTYCLLAGLTALLSRLPAVRRWLGHSGGSADLVYTCLLLGSAGVLTDLLVAPVAFVSVNTRYIPPVVAGMLGGPVSGLLTGLVVALVHTLVRLEQMLEPGLLVPSLVGLVAGLLARWRRGRWRWVKTAGIAAAALLTDSVLDVWLERVRPELGPELLIQAGNLVAIMLALGLLQWEQQEGAKRQQIQTMAFTDGLTQLHNYRSFRAGLESIFRQCRASGTPLSLVLMDVDGFKQYNDRFGHPAGNQVLERVGAAIRSELRATDLGARYGGDEFALILPGTTEAGAWALVQRIQERLEAAVRLSPGVASYPATAGDEEMLIKKADEAMYLAKRADALLAHDLTAAAAELSLKEH